MEVEKLRVAIGRAARADHVKIDRSKDGNLYVKVVRERPVRVGYNFYIASYSYGSDSEVMSTAENVGWALDELQEEEMRKKKGPSPVSPEDIRKPSDWDSVEIKGVGWTPVVKKEIVSDLADDFDDFDELDDPEDDELMEELEKLEVATKVADKHASKSFTDQYEEVVKALSAANAVGILDTKDAVFQPEFDASVTGADWGPLNLNEGTELRLDRIVFYTRIERVVVQMKDENSTTYMVPPEDMDDLLPELSLLIDQAVAENSTFGSLVHVNKAVKNIVKGKPALGRSLTEDVARVLSDLVGKMEEHKKASSVSYYERQSAYGLI